MWIEEETGQCVDAGGDRSVCGRRRWVSVRMEEETGQCAGGEMTHCLEALVQQS